MVTITYENGDTLVYTIDEDTQDQIWQGKPARVRAAKRYEDAGAGMVGGDDPNPMLTIAQWVAFETDGKITQSDPSESEPGVIY